MNPVPYDWVRHIETGDSDRFYAALKDEAFVRLVEMPLVLGAEVPESVIIGMYQFGNNLGMDSGSLRDLLQ